jgi:hypothetical protein
MAPTNGVGYSLFACHGESGLGQIEIGGRARDFFPWFIPRAVFL